MNKFMIYKKLMAAFMMLSMTFAASAQFRQGASYEDLYDGETVSVIKAHVRELSAAHLEGRKAGSEGEKYAAEYEEKYGPLTPMSGVGCDSWKWIQGPWPWESEAN